MWSLSRRWYGNRLDANYRPPDVDLLQRWLTEATLVGDFWQLA